MEYLGRILKTLQVIAVLISTKTWCLDGTCNPIFMLISESDPDSMSGQPIEHILKYFLRKIFMNQKPQSSLFGRKIANLLFSLLCEWYDSSVKSVKIV